MTTHQQEESLSVLREIRTLAPDLRLGQLLAHLGFLGEIHVGRGLGDIEDDELLAVLYRHRAELVARTQGLPHPEPTSDAVSVSGSAIAESPR